MLAPATGFYSDPEKGRKQARITYCLKIEDLKAAVKCLEEALKVYPDEDYKKIMRFILEKNILQGDSLNGIDQIIFTQWTLVGYQFKREEYSFS